MYRVYLNSSELALPETRDDWLAAVAYARETGARAFTVYDSRGVAVADERGEKSPPPLLTPEAA